VSLLASPPAPAPVVRTRERLAEVSWFAPLCNDDYEHLGVPDPAFKSTFDHTADILLAADRLGYNNILCPSSYQVGQDTLLFAAGVAPRTRAISLLTAVRCGELHPLMLGRSLATLDHMLSGRLTVNIISSDMPGESADSALRYRRSREVIEVLKQCWTRETVDYEGEFYRYKDVPTDPVKPYQQNGGPLLYFGGMSPDAMDLCAQHCDVFLMWPETEDRLASHMRVMSEKAAAHGRAIDFGLRVHVIVRETEAEARAQAHKLVSRLDDAVGEAIRARALDSKSYGVARQAQMRDLSDDDGYIEPHLWTGIGRARSGCSCALVGDPDQIVAQLGRYMDMGIRAFIFSGYPHREECGLFARHVLPRLPRASLARIQKRIPERDPLTPLAAGSRK
jgi:alkanesulfonate monooxygenase